MSSPQTATAPLDGETSPYLLRHANDAVLRLVLNRPKQRNPLSMEMLAALTSALNEAALDDTVRAVIIAADGPGFCGGHDLKQMTSHRGDEDGGRGHFETLFGQCAQMMQSIVDHPKIIIAQVQGIATAAGCQLVAACDMAVASDAARFGVNGIDSGLFCSTPMVALSRNIGRKAIMELLTTGRLMTAKEALAAGLVNQVTTADQLSSAADAMAAKVAHKSLAVLKLGKQAFYKQLEMPLAEAYRYTSKVIVDNMMMDDAREGIGAFIEKRKPEWRDK